MVFLILDNLNVHKAKPVRTGERKTRNELRSFACRHTRSELNPSEYFNGDLKSAIQRGIPPRDQSELKRTILAQSRRVQKSPNRVQKYFEHELIRYAA